MKYAVAYMNFFDNDLKMIQVEAGHPIIALIEGVRELIDTSGENTEWLDDLLKPVPPAEYASRLEEIRNDFFDTDQVVNVMLIE